MIISMQYHNYIFDVYNKPNRLKIEQSTVISIVHHRPNVMNEQAACGKMAAMWQRRSPLASSAGESSSVYIHLCMWCWSLFWEKRLKYLLQRYEYSLSWTPGRCIFRRSITESQRVAFKLICIPSLWSQRTFSLKIWLKIALFDGVECSVINGPI